MTSKTTLDAYQAIAVPELWVYDHAKLNIYLLRDGQYIQSNRGYFSDWSRVAEDSDFVVVIPGYVF